MPGRAILVAEEVVPGGRVELPTPAFSGPRSTGELPRHGAVKDCTGARDLTQVAECRSVWPAHGATTSCHSEARFSPKNLSLIGLGSKRDSSLRSE